MPDFPHRRGLPRPTLVIEYWSDNAATHGRGTHKGVIFDALKVGWSWYSRFPANAFFTLRQTSEHNARLVAGLDHVKISYRALDGSLVTVFTGRVGDPDESGEDVIWTCWNYLAELSLSLSGFRRLYPEKAIGTEVARAEWDGDTTEFPDYGAKVQPDSLLNHIATGTFEDPEVGGLPIKTDTRFGVIKVPRLLLFFDLSEMGRANTSQNVTYYITRDDAPAFHFRKNHGSLVASRRLTFPGNLRDFRFVPGVLTVRNKLSTIAAGDVGAATVIEKSIATGTYGHDNFGLREDVFTIKTLAGIFGTATEFDAQVKVVERAVKEATELTAALRVDVLTQHLEPFIGWEIEDTIRVQAKRGRTNIDADYRIVGVRATQDQQGYHQSLFLTLPTAA